MTTSRNSYDENSALLPGMDFYVKIDDEDNIDPHRSASFEEKAKKLQLKTLIKALGETSQNCLSGIVFAATAVEVYTVASGFLGMKEEDLRICPNQTDDMNTKMKVLFFENGGFFTFWAAFGFRAIVLPVCYKLIDKCFRYINGKPVLAEETLEFLSVTEKRILSALMAFCAIQQTEIKVGDYDARNILSAAAAFPLIQLAAEYGERKLRESAPSWYPLFMKGIRSVGYGGYTLATIKSISDSFINYVINGTREVNWEGQATLTTYLSLGSFASGVVGGYLVEKNKDNVQVSNINNTSKEIFAFLLTAITLFNIPMSVDDCLNPESFKPKNYGKDDAVIKYMLYLLGGIVLSGMYLVFTKAFNYIEKKPDVKLKHFVEANVDNEDVIKPDNGQDASDEDNKSSSSNKDGVMDISEDENDQRDMDNDNQQDIKEKIDTSLNQKNDDNIVNNTHEETSDILEATKPFPVEGDASDSKEKEIAANEDNQSSTLSEEVVLGISECENDQRDMDDYNQQDIQQQIDTSLNQKNDDNIVNNKQEETSDVVEVTKPFPVGRDGFFSHVDSSTIESTTTQTLTSPTTKNTGSN